MALTSSGHEGKIYDLTSQELLSVPDQVCILSEVIGKPIQCVDIPITPAMESSTDVLVAPCSGLEGGG